MRTWLPDDDPGEAAEDIAYYVSMIDEPRIALITGPHPTRAAAEADLPRAKRLGEARDAFACFYAWGIARARRDAHGFFPRPVFENEKH